MYNLKNVFNTHFSNPGILTNFHKIPDHRTSLKKITKIEITQNMFSDYDKSNNLKLSGKKGFCLKIKEAREDITSAVRVY